MKVLNVENFIEEYKLKFKPTSGKYSERDIIFHLQNFIRKIKQRTVLKKQGIKFDFDTQDQFEEFNDAKIAHTLSTFTNLIQLNNSRLIKNYNNSQSCTINNLDEFISFVSTVESEAKIYEQKALSVENLLFNPIRVFCLTNDPRYRPHFLFEIRSEEELDVVKKKSSIRCKSCAKKQDVQKILTKINDTYKLWKAH